MTSPLSSRATPRVTPWWLRGRELLPGCIGLVLALLVGLTSCLARPATEGRAPFDQAVAALAVAPAVHYHSSALGGAMSWDVRVTGHDDAVGTITLDGEQIGVLTVGGRTFLKPPEGLLPNQATNTPAAALKGKWITGGGLTEGGILGSNFKQLQSPSKLAQTLGDALSQTADFPAPGAAGTTVNGVPALEVSTPAGDLYVAKNAPYRVLRLTPAVTGLHSLPTLPARPQPPFSVVPVSVSTPLSRPPTVYVAAYQPDDRGAHASPPFAAFGGPADDLGDTEFPAMSPEDVDHTYDDLMSGARQLSDAVDNDIQFTMTGNATLHCSESGCEVTATVTSHIDSTAESKTVAGGQVSAELTADVEIDGQAAGSCIPARKPLPFNGTDEISCEAPAAGAVFAAVEAEKKAQAEAESRAEGGTEVPYSIMGTGTAYVKAIAQVDVAATEQRLDSERIGARQRQPIFVPGLSNPWTDAERGPIEQVLGGNLDVQLPEGHKYPVFDNWDPDTRTMTSVKTIDYRADTYRVESVQIVALGKRYVNDVTNFRDHFDGYWADWMPANLRIGPSGISHYILVIGFPAGASPDQLAPYMKIVRYGDEKGITVILQPVAG